MSVANKPYATRTGDAPSGPNGLGMRMQQRRVEQGITQAALAEHVNANGQTVKDWESGRRLPGAWNLLEIATLLKMPLEALLDTDTKTGSTTSRYQP